MIQKRALGLVITGLVFVVILRYLETVIIYPAPRYPAGNWAPAWEFEDVTFQSADGTQLHGWYLPAKTATTILYCHGNGTHVAYVAEGLRKLQVATQASIFVFDYRGYGRSAGRPDESGVLADGAAALDWLVNRTGQSPGEIFVMGRSLGGAVALDLAARHGARGLILERTFTRLTDVATNLYPFLPVRMIMRNRYDNLQRVVDYDGPLLQSHGTDDSLIPLHQARQLFDASPSPQKTLHVMAGVDHNSANTAEYESALHEFLTGEME